MVSAPSSGLVRYLITGVAGFIGARVAELALDQGYQVVGVDNLNDAYDIRLKLWRLGQLEGRDGFQFHRMDLTERAATASLFDKSSTAEAPAYDAVLHLAARAGMRPSVDNPWVYLDANATATVNLLQECVRSGVRKFVLSSTSSLYGSRNPLPYTEDADTDHPLSPYAASKKAAEAFAHAAHHLHDLDITVLRYFTVYGPAGRPDMSLFRFVQWVAEGRPVVLYGDGSQSRDFTYIDDIAQGTLAAVRPLGFQVVNLGSDRPTMLGEVLAYIEELLGKKATVHRRSMHPADMPATWASIEQARRLLGWQPSTHWKQGIARLVSWYLENRSMASQIDTRDL